MVYFVHAAATVLVVVDDDGFQSFLQKPSPFLLLTLICLLFL